MQQKLKEKESNMEDFIYNDYSSFKIENGEMIKALENSIITARFKHVVMLADYIFELKMNDVEISNELEDIFSYAFDYIFTAYNNLKLLFEQYFTSYDEMIKIAKTINLYLYSLDFMLEFEDDENYNKDDYDKLELFSEGILKYIENHEEVEDGHFVLLDELTKNMFKDYVSTLGIFYDICVELNLIDEE